MNEFRVRKHNEFNIYHPSRFVKLTQGTGVTYNRSKGNFITNFAWWILNKFSVLDWVMDEQESWKYTIIDRNKLSEEIFKTVKDLRYFAESPDKYALVIGGRTFQEIVGSPDFHHYFSLPLNSLAYSGQLFNIDAHVVPHLEGMALIPKVVIENHVVNSNK